MGDHITSTISVMLVLFILGVVALVNITFSGIERQVKERVGFTVVMADSVPSSAADAVQEICRQAPYVSSFRYMTADEVMTEETQGEQQDLVEVLGINPFSPMLEVRVKPAYAHPDSIAALVQQWQKVEGVDEVSANTELIGSLNRNANLLNTVLLVVAGALLLISFVLINNTVRLTVYARRFLIHTMKLVGATGGFIRRPFLLSNMAQGVVAGLLGGGLLIGAVAWGHNLDAALQGLLPWWVVFIVLGGMVVLGVLICLIAATIATNRYLRADYDEMFD